MRPAAWLLCLLSFPWAPAVQGKRLRPPRPIGTRTALQPRAGAPAAAPHDGYRLQVPLSLPFLGAWTAYNATPGQGGAHGGTLSQRHAVDWLISHHEGGKRRTCRGRCRDNADFFAYGREVLAPADGVVVQVVDGVPDNRPGELDVYFRLGNTVIVRIAPGEYAYLSHLQPGSIVVRPGDVVRRGQLLARCGNSGNSSEPHLHFQVADGPRLSQAASLPLRFRDVLRNGERVPEATPRSGEVYAPATEVPQRAPEPAPPEGAALPAESGPAAPDGGADARPSPGAL